MSIFALLFISLAVVLYVSGFRINTTKSIPLGVYITLNSEPKVGDYVIICPPKTSVFKEAKKRGYLEAGFCPGELSYMMKKILAAKKDQVEISIKGVLINGRFLPGSEPFLKDGSNRPMPIPNINVSLAENDVLLMGDRSSKSFDARYFGIVNKAQIKNVIKPVFTW